MEKTLWIIANWKSNKNIGEALEWLAVVGPKLPRNEKLKVAVCPQFTELEELKKEVQVGGYPLLVGSQDLSPFPQGSFTGEESAQTLHQFVDLAILGHSERRKNFGETDEMVADKAKQALENQIIPLVCVQDENTPVPEGVKLIAYEPIFAIGTGTPDTPDNANKVSGEIMAKNENVTVLYGGSVNSENATAFVKQENIAGLLIGKSSLDAEEFVKIVTLCEELV